MQILKADTSAVIMLGPAVDKTDGVTLESGLVTAMDTATTGVRISKNGGAWTDRNGTVTTTVYDEGWYRVTLDSTDTNTEGTLDVMYEDAATCLPMFARFQVVNANVYDSLFAASGTDLLQVDTTQIGGTTQTARDIGASVLLSPGTGTGQISLTSGAVTAGTVSDKTGYSLTATTGLGNQTANITGNLSGSVGSVTGAVGSVTGNVGGNVTGSVGSISGVTFPTNFGDLSISVTTGLVDITQTAADKAWSTTTRVLTANTNLNDPTAAAIRSEMDSNSTRLAAIETDTQDIQSRIPAALVGGRVDANVGAISTSATAADNLELSALQMIPFTVTGTPTSTTVAASGLTSSTTADDQLIGRVVVFTSGNAQYEAARITDYTHATGTMVLTELAVTPSATDTGIII